jgi:hypothetical protein
MLAVALTSGMAHAQDRSILVVKEFAMGTTTGWLRFRELQSQTIAELEGRGGSRFKVLGKLHVSAAMLLHGTPEMPRSDW